MQRGLASAKYSKLFLLLAGLSACAKPRTFYVPSDAQQTGIVGGEAVAPGEWSAVVGLVFRGSLICTGTLITPQVVLTAAHCISDSKTAVPTIARLEDYYQIYVGNGRPGGHVMQGQFEIEKISVHPLWKKSLLYENDFAVIRLKKPVADVKPLSLLHDFDDVKTVTKPGTPVRLIGFGKRGVERDAPVGEKYTVQTQVVRQVFGEIELGELGKDSCFGDSGGPAVYEAKGQAPMLFGVVSRGRNACGQVDSSSNREPSFWGLAHDSICWIESAAGEKLDHDFPCANGDNLKPSNQTSSDDFAAFCDKPKNLSDLHVAHVIQAALGNFECGVLANKLQNISELDISNGLFTDIRFLKSASRLEKLDLRNNHISDFSILDSLPALKRVDLSWNDGDGNALKSLKANYEQVHGGAHIVGTFTQRGNFLQTQFLCDCQDPNLSGPTRKTVLAVMDAIATQQMMSDGQEPLTCEFANQQLVRIESLNLSGHDLQDISPLNGLELLQRVDLSANEISDFSPVQTLAGLKSLNVSFNPITSAQIKAVTSQTRAEIESQDTPSTLLAFSSYQACMHQNDLKLSPELAEPLAIVRRVVEDDTNPLLQLQLMLSNANCKALIYAMRRSSFTSMNLSGLKLTTYETIHELTSPLGIYRLDLSGNDLKELPDLEGVIVSDLDLSNNKFVTGESLLQLKSVNRMNLENNQISDFAFLNKIPGLMHVSVKGNPVKNFVCPVHECFTDQSQLALPSTQKVVGH